MSQTGVSLIWCVVQVTLIGLVTGTLYAVIRRIRRAAALPVVLAGLVAVVVLTTLAFSPWPRWSLLSGPESGPAAISNPLDTSARTAATPGNPPDTLSTGGQAQAPITGSDGRVSYWAILLEELSRSEVPDVSSGWSWSAVVTAMFLSASGLALLWFAAGTVAVRGYGRRSRPIQDPTLLEQIDVLRAELACLCPVELRETDELVTAATIGWRRPVILLPKGWRDWTPPQRLAVLAHELAHIRAGDYLAMTLGQFGLVLHFYHPLIHWLLARLRLEQELAADAAAASVSGGQREYLKAIAELALRQPHRPMAWPARSFLPTRTTFLRRISMLRDSKLNVEKLSPAARAFPIGMILAFGVLIAGLRGPVVDHPALADEAASTASEQPSERGAIDLTYVSKDAWAVLAIRPSEIFSRPEFKELGEQLSQMSRTGLPLDLPLEELEQATLVWSDPLEKLAVGHFSPEDNVTIILRARGPHSFDKFVARMVSETSSCEHEGRIYYLGKRGPHTLGYHRPDNRTVVLWSANNLTAMISGRSHGVPEFIDTDTWEEFQEDHLVVAVNSNALENLVNSVKLYENAPMLSPLGPLWESTSSLVLGIGLDDRLGIHGVAVSDDDGETKQVKQTLDALVVLSRNAIDQGRKKLRKEGGDRTGLLVFAVDTCARLLDSLKIEQQGNTVRLAASADLESIHLSPFTKAIQGASQAATRSQSANNLKQIALAMHMFHDDRKRFPPAAARTSKTHRPMEDYPPHSWRVALLPFVNEADLYEQYRFDEPWDSPENLKILEKMPAVYRNPGAPSGSTDTCYFALTGPGTVFPGKEGTPIREIRDGTSNTLLAVEAKRAVPWTKPEDIPYDSEKPIPELGGHFEGGFNAAFCDGSVRFMANSIDKKVLRALISRSGGEPVAPY
jgi:prepilin-type processing-associated H-X9-DG protein